MVPRIALVRSLGVLVVVAACLAACSLGGTLVEQTPRQIALNGRLGADSVDCVWVEDASGVRTSLALPPDFTVALDPTRVVRSDGTVAATGGDTVQVFGVEAIGETLCSSRPPFPVKTLIRVSAP